MNPIAAIALRDQREKAGWDAFNSGLDEARNLQTYAKDKKLTTGKGLFNGFFDSQEEPGIFEPFKEPELADIHRWAKIKGLRHDQGVVDEKTTRPQREAQMEIQKENQSHSRQMEQWKSIASDARQARIEENQIRDAAMRFVQANPDWDKEGTTANETYLQMISDWSDATETRKKVEATAKNYNLPDWMYTDRTYSEGNRRGAGGGGAGNDFVSSEDVMAIVGSTIPQGGFSASSTEITPEQIMAANTAAGNSLAARAASEYNSQLKAWREANSYQIGTQAAGQDMAGKGMGLKEQKAQQETAIQTARNSISDLDRFISNPTFDNWKTVSDKFTKMPQAQRTSFGKIPVIGGVLDYFNSQRDMSQEDFSANKAAYIQQARNSKSQFEAYVNSFGKPKAKQPPQGYKQAVFGSNKGKWVNPETKEVWNGN
jgi:organic hydroperoxide reductase OsmC/OhrA